MARRVVQELTDDLDGGPATQTIRFTIQGTDYEIDLSDDHADEFMAMLDGYTSAGRRIGGRRRSTPSPAAPAQRAASEPDGKTVREWATSQGIQVSPRGRISRDVMEQYRAAHAA